MKNGIPNEPGKLKEFIFVPGNHDCCFDDVDEVANREKLIGDTLGYNGTVPPSVVNISCKLQKHFEDFVAEYSSQPETHNSLISVRNYIVNSFPINIYCFNTAWMSMKNEEKSDQPGKMYMPMNMLNNELFLRESKLNIAVLHHPDLWRNPTNAREFQRLIERTSDLAFIGHSHKEEQNLVDNLKHKRTIYVNGGAFKDKEKPGICQFKTICGGCRARAYIYSKDPLNQDPACAYQPKKAKKT